MRGGNVISRNSGKDGICAKCGPVAFDVVQEKVEQVKAVNAWRKRYQENVAEIALRRSRDLEAEIGKLLSEGSFPLADLERRHPITLFDILPGLPPYGPSAILFPESGRGSFSEGLVVKISPSNRETWVGNFQRALSGPDIGLEHPDQRHIIVIAGGVGYIIDPETAKQTHQLSDSIKHVIPAPDLGAVVLGDDCNLNRFALKAFGGKAVEFLGMVSEA